MYRLKIGGYDVDVTNDISLKFTYSNTDVSDPAAVKNSFSKTIKIPGTANNNNIFGQIWKTNRSLSPDAYKNICSGFNPKKKIGFELTNDGALIEKGYVKLNKVTSNFYFQEYEITLYGELGEFFYNLSTNDDGSKKTLADLYYGFSPAINVGDSKAILENYDEDTSILMKWTSPIICEGWHELSYMREPSATTKVNNFITAVPCLTGLYDDFDSKSMIVNNLIRYQGMPDDCLDKWNESLPTSFTTDEQTYTLYQDPLSPYKSCYSKIEYPRDIEGIEAGDLRATELPVAIKLSKVLEAIAATGNNGGFEVEYSTALTTSYYWKNGWIMLDKPDFTLLPDNAEMNVSNIYVDANLHKENGVVVPVQNINDGFAQWSISPFDISNMQNPELNLVFNNKVTVFETMYPGSESVDLTHINEISNNYYWGFPHPGGHDTISEWEPLGSIWKGLCCVVDLYDGNTVRDSRLILFHVDNQNHHFGQDTINSYMGVSENVWKPAIISRVNSYYGTNFSDMSVHQCIHTTYRNGIIEYAEPVVEIIPIEFSSTDFRVKFRFLPIGYYKGKPNIGTGFTEVSQAYLPNIDPLISYVPQQGDMPCRYQRCPYHYPHHMYMSGTEGWRSLEYTAYLHHKTILGFNYAFNIGVTQEQEYYKTVNATKKVLLSNSMSPFELLTGISKMFNMKYVYDMAEHKVRLLTNYEYYLNKTQPVKLDSRCNFNKNLVHNFILSESKYIDFSYAKNDAYPVYLWRKNNDKEYESYIFDTGLEFNFDTKKFFDNKFKQSSLYQINSQFLKKFQGMILPSVFGTNVFDYSLFAQGQNSVIDEESIQKQTGCSNPNSKVKSDPWLCLFDKSQKRLNDQMPSLVFLNGFYKNFRQIECHTKGVDNKLYFNVPNIMVSDDFYVEEFLNADRCWLWSYEFQYGTYTGYGYSFEHNACVWAMPFFSRDLTTRISGAEWINSKRTLASWDMVYDYTDYYTENGMVMVKYPTTFSLYATSQTAVAASAITTIADVDKSQSTQKYLYTDFWQSTMEDLYDNDGRELECWIDLQGEDPYSFLRKFYILNGSTWIVEKIFDVERKDIKTDFVKCKLVKVRSQANLLNMTIAQQEQTQQQIIAIKDEIDLGNYVDRTYDDIYEPIDPEDDPNENEEP